MDRAAGTQRLVIGSTQVVNAREYVNTMVAECYPDEVKKGGKKKLLTQMDDDEEDKEQSIKPSRTKRGAEEDEDAPSQRSRAKGKDVSDSHSVIEMEDIDV